MDARNRKNRGKRFQRRAICLALGIVLCAWLAGAYAGEPQDDWLDITPARGWDHPLVLRRSGFSYNCNECHRDFVSPPAAKASPGEHRAIVLEHGTEMTCLSCHGLKDRTQFRDYEGNDLAPENSMNLCATCHGTVYRDWTAGAHGRANGYWDAAAGPSTKLVCIQCHDPHSPGFKAMVPLPPPLLTGPEGHNSEGRHE